MNLVESFRKVLAKITANGCIAVEGNNGWYHSFDKTLVKNRVAEIKSEINRLEYKFLNK